MITFDLPVLPTIAVIFGIPSFMLAVVVGSYRLGKLSDRIGRRGKNIEQLKVQVTDLTTRVVRLDAKVDQLDGKVDQLDGKVDQLAGDTRDGFRELREEMRRGNQQLLLALANHSHRENGQVIFTVPVTAE